MGTIRLPGTRPSTGRNPRSVCIRRSGRSWARRRWDPEAWRTACAGLECWQRSLERPVRTRGPRKQRTKRSPCMRERPSFSKGRGRCNEVAWPRTAGRRTWAIDHRTLSPQKPETSYLVGHYERLAILAREQAIGFRVAGAGIAGGIETQRTAQAVGNVGQVNQRRGDGALFDGRVKVRRLAAAHGVNEVGPVIAHRLDGGRPRPRLLVAAEPGGVLVGVFVPHREIALGAVERGSDGVTGFGLADAGFVVGDPVADFKDQYLLRGALVEFESGGQGVGRLLIVIENEMAAEAADRGGIFHSQAPAGHIELVNSLVAQVAVAVIPKPVPVVVQPVSRVLVLGRRSQPEIVVDARRHGFHRLAADGVAPFEAEAAGHVDVAEQAILDVLHNRAADAGALLAAVLHHAPVLPRGKSDLAGLEHIVRAGLLHVDVLAGLARPDGLERMAVVGGGDGDGVDRLVFQELAQVGVSRGTLSLGFFERGYLRVEHRFIDVAEGGDFHVGHLAVGADMVPAPAAEAHASDSNCVVGTGERAGTKRRARRDRGTQKVSSVQAR